MNFIRPFPCRFHDIFFLTAGVSFGVVRLYDEGRKADSIGVKARQEHVYSIGRLSYFPNNIPPIFHFRLCLPISSKDLYCVVSASILPIQPTLRCRSIDFNGRK